MNKTFYDVGDGRIININCISTVLISKNPIGTEILELCLIGTDEHIFIYGKEAAILWCILQDMSKETKMQFKKSMKSPQRVLDEGYSDRAIITCND